MPPREACWPSGPSLVRRDVLIHPEDVAGVVLALQRLEPLVLAGSVRHADSILALLHQEVDVNAHVVWAECRPQAPRPLALLVEAGRTLGGRIDVDGVTRAAPVERGLVLADTGDCPAE